MNNLVPIPLQRETVEVRLSTATPDFGTCAQCGQGLEEAEFAIGDVCDGYQPAFMERWQADQEAAVESRAEAHRCPDESDECDCLGYGCHECS